MFPSHTILLSLVSLLACEEGFLGQESKNKKRPVVYVTMVSHFDRPWTMEANDLAALRNLTKNHPQMRWTHLYNPVAYTTPTPLRKKMEDYVKESRDEYGAEIGVHLHMYRTFVESAGVKYRTRPSVSAQQARGSSDPSGYSVPMSAYNGDEISGMLDFTLAKFKDQGLGVPRTFCAGFYTTNLELQKRIAAGGYTASAAAFPPGREIGAQYAPSWHELSGWDASITIRSAPYRISQKSILPTSTEPFLQAYDGKPLVEIPQNSKIDWMVSANDMKRIIGLHVEKAKAGEPTAVCLAIHEGSAHEHFNKYDEVLSHVDRLASEKDEVAVLYATVSEVRTRFLQHWNSN